MSVLAVLILSGGCRKKASAPAADQPFGPPATPKPKPKPPNPADEPRSPHDAAGELAGFRVQITSMAIGRIRLRIRGRRALAGRQGADYRHTLDLCVRPVGGVVRSRAIAPGETITDVINFMKPQPSATEFHLDLPASKYGGKGKIRFRIPATAVEGFPPAK